MSEAPPDLPASGLAEEMIPILRSRLGLPEKGAPAAAPIAPTAPTAPARPAILEFAEATQARAAPAPVAAPKILQVVLFSLDREQYAVPIASVHEILRVTPIARVPEAPRHVRGVMNVRGRLLPVVEIRTILGMSALAIEAESRVIKATVRGRLIGLLVDRVSYVLSVPESALEPPPRDLGERADFVSGVLLQEEQIVLLVDLERTLSLPG